MTPIEKAREALAAEGVLAATDEQVTRCIALAAYHLADKCCCDRRCCNPFGSAAREMCEGKRPCVLTPARPARWTVDFGAFGEPDDNHTLTIDVDGVATVFRLRYGSLVVAGPGEFLIDTGSAARDTACAMVINQTDIGVHATTDDPILHLAGPFGMKVTATAPSLVTNEVDPGNAANCSCAPLKNGVL